jgi:hypothetical protein
MRYEYLREINLKIESRAEKKQMVVNYDHLNYLKYSKLDLDLVAMM